MPDVKVYIRADDIEKWNSIEKKSEFIHNALTANVDLGALARLKEPGDGTIRPIITSDGSRRYNAFVEPEKSEPRFCKNGHPIPYPKDKCLVKGCEHG